MDGMAFLRSPFDRRIPRGRGHVRAHV